MTRHDVPLRGEFIELHNLLKFCAIADSGGQAKVLVGDGLVTVDGEQELRKTRKLYAGSVVRIWDHEIHVLPSEA
ncbi:RNA-binding S4 domain-containing protein [Chitinimonas sp. BJYL2]|uniref:RNA-binding S4 domain-containing protein n=1 Tax=Chitinimonas sp. BJYL2 TaxID=2976696 RepID=UPI0022B36F69|nr:RNA-binding S4 domain-containing protein [Chitinimonas sp. BJYL2]